MKKNQEFFIFYTIWYYSCVLLIVFSMVIGTILSVEGRLNSYYTILSSREGIFIIIYYGISCFNLLMCHLTYSKIKNNPYIKQHTEFQKKRKIVYYFSSSIPLVLLIFPLIFFSGTIFILFCKISSFLIPILNGLYALVTVLLFPAPRQNEV